MPIWWPLAVALALEPGQVLDRVEATRSFRSLRLDDQAPTHGPEVYERALATGAPVTGTVAVEGQRIPMAWAVAVYPVSIGSYWATISDDIGKATYTRTIYSEILEGERCKSPRRVFQFVPVPWMKDRWWVAVSRSNDALAKASGGALREQVWATDGDFTVTSASATAWAARGIHPTSTRGSWLLMDLGGGSTLVEYATWSDPGGSMPDGMIKLFADAGIADNLDTMAKAARDGLSGCPVW